MKIDGGCFCGKVTFEAEIHPENVRVCHCTDCQIMSGAPYRVNVVADKGKVVLKGEVKTFLKVAESGNKRLQAFCPECGTSLYSCAEKDAPSYTLRVGTIRQRAELRPRTQQWCRSAMEWAGDLNELPKFEKQRPA